MNIIIYDIHITGHHSEYIDHIVSYLVSTKNEHNFYFIVHPDFCKRFANIVSKSSKNPRIYWVPISLEEQFRWDKSSLFSRSFHEYNLLLKYANKYQVKLVYLMYFNTLQISLIFKRPPFKIRGILFQQFTQMSKKTWKEKFKYYRKYLTTKLYSINNQIERIFILNDSESVIELNSRFYSNIFRMLPDPVPILESMKGYDLRGKYNLSSQVEIFLHFGSLADRKGTFEFLEAAELIPLEHQNNIVMLLVGKPDSSYTENKISNLINSLVKKSQVKIIWENQFVSNELMRSIFLQSSVVVIPYKNSEASSGILGHAIAAKKPVIITGKGLLKQIVEGNKFGIMLDHISPKEIASAMLKSTKIKSNDMRFDHYLNEHRPTTFSKILLNNIDADFFTEKNQVIDE